MVQPHHPRPVAFVHAPEGAKGLSVGMNDARGRAIRVRVEPSGGTTLRVTPVAPLAVGARVLLRVTGNQGDSAEPVDQAVAWAVAAAPTPAAPPTPPWTVERAKGANFCDEEDVATVRAPGLIGPWAVWTEPSRPPSPPTAILLVRYPGFLDLGDPL